MKYLYFNSAIRAIVSNRLIDDIIFSPGVTVFKSDTDAPELLPESARHDVDVITCAISPKKAKILTGKRLAVGEIKIINKTTPRLPEIQLAAGANL